MKIEIEIPDNISVEKFISTVDELCGKGIRMGCFQDYEVLCTVLSCMTQVEVALKKKTN